MENSTFFSDQALERWKEGVFHSAHEWLGAQPLGDGKTRFAVWAPNAASVRVAGSFNDWEPSAGPMQKDDATGIWFAEIEGAKKGDLYKYRVRAGDGAEFWKADPFAFYAEQSPGTASVLYPLEPIEWNDDSWMEQRGNAASPSRPLSIYEVHPGSWKRKRGADPGYLSYTELADRLIPYVREMGFTHIEFMPVAEHPYDPSWGYQVTGYYAPTNRYGTPHDFMQFINRCHEAGIGLILDWVPGHFPDDEHGLALFDGTPLYEHSDPRRSRQEDWGTNNFDHEKPEVRNFLLSNAFYWADRYHIDGLRVDGVASMLYLDYSKSKDKWLPNIYGGKKNLGAMAFLQDLNQQLHGSYPALLTIAEESTPWPGITDPVSESGMGFDYKWNMGWMNDTLHFFELDAESRLENSHQVTFPITFAFNERFVLPLSHDEVVHLKKSLWNKMPGDEQEKAAQLKLLLLYWMVFPGKKLLFMGGEFGQRGEWSESAELEWALLERDLHKDIRDWTAGLLHFYKEHSALYETDCTSRGFEWLDLSRKEDGFYAFARKNQSGNSSLAVVFNVSGRSLEWDPGILKNRQGYRPLFDTRHGLLEAAGHIETELSPFTGVILGSKDGQ